MLFDILSVSCGTQSNRRIWSNLILYRDIPTNPSFIFARILGRGHFQWNLPQLTVDY